MELDDLKLQESILAFSYWENWKYHRELAQGFGGKHPKTIRIGKAVEEIQKEWHKIQEKIKTIETK